MLTTNGQDRPHTARFESGQASTKFSIRNSTLGPDVIDIASLYKDTGMFTYDPGFTSTASCESKITFIDGDEGILLHRGYPIDQLAEHGDFLETCYLLLYGELPRPRRRRKISTIASRATRWCTSRCPPSSVASGATPTPWR